MKKTLILLLSVLTAITALKAQDTAEAIVERYLSILNYDALPKDSMLTFETTVRYRDNDQRFVIRQYYAPNEMRRVEVWRGDTLITGLCTNGSTRFRRYSTHTQWWDDIPANDLDAEMQAYDFRGPLFHWRERGIKIDYQGTSEIEGHLMQVVRTKQKKHFTRYYFFDANSGLLNLITEKEEGDEGIKHIVFRLKPIDFKFIHEYTPIGNSLVVTQESFMRDDILTIMETTLRVEPIQTMIFNQD